MSDKKHLLNESTVRRFMKLASIGGLSDGYVDKHKETLSEMGSVYGRDEEEFPPGPPEDLGGAPGEELPPEDLGGEEGLEPEPALDPEEPASEATVSELVDAIATAITDSTGIEVSTEESAEELEAPVDLEEPAPEEGLPGEMPPEEEMPAEEAPLEESSEELMMERLVSRVAQRVAARLLEKSKK